MGANPGGGGERDRGTCPPTILFSETCAFNLCNSQLLCVDLLSIYNVRHAIFTSLVIRYFKYCNAMNAVEYKHNLCTSNLQNNKNGTNRTRSLFHNSLPFTGPPYTHPSPIFLEGLYKVQNHQIICNNHLSTCINGYHYNYYHNNHAEWPKLFEPLYYFNVQFELIKYGANDRAKTLM